MSSAKFSLGKPMTAEQYAQEWEINSRSFSNEGYYRWMVEQLGAATKVLEVGCGSGNGTIALVKSGCKVVVIEPNRPMINIAIKNLKGAGYDAVEVDLRQLAAQENDAPSVSIIHGDVFSLEFSETSVKAKFDAVVCWLVGSEPERQAEHLNKKLEDFDGPEAAYYRELIHARCYKIGESLLKKSGVVHLVDRGGIRSWSDKDDARDSLVAQHQELAGDAYDVSRSNTFLRKLHSDMKASHINYIAEQAAASAITVFSSVKGVLR
ncbi:class I SAM-dependent methyltransferase [Pseudomonas oryzihabitans]|uniref:class I SAM-dependent methyltransferase n=1 Tax=Pseudomonas oryzihabitans TaxID=47885 RepID=UPI0028956A53|nr:class I SAM-dependent methyltransferase [Pseudomonas oryzihabitans]MDT3723133.1 class I SAM-dependent methyltransferase [Pseudomonas oryzihabitans]